MLAVKSTDGVHSGRLESSGIEYKIIKKTSKTAVLDELLEGVLVLIDLPADLDFEYQLLDKEASGVIWFPINDEDIEDAIDTINKGGKWFSRITLTKKISDSLDKDNSGASINSFGFTKREKQIFEQIKLGLSNKEIARNKCISEATVKSHIKNILAKTNTKNRTALLIQLSK